MTDPTWDELNRLYQMEAPADVRDPRADRHVLALIPYDPALYRWDEQPPDDGACRDCYEWRRYPPGQRHFGLTWWRTCSHDCECAHHADEVWLA